MLLPVVAIGTLTVMMLLLVVVRNGFRRQRAHLSALTRQSAVNHKRASEWNWRLNQRLTGLDATALQSGAQHRGAVGRDAGWKNHPLAQELLRLEVFDSEYYAAVAGANFGREADAASHYLSVGIRDLIGPNPFVDVEELPEVVRSAMADGRAGDLIQLLAGVRGHSAQLGPLFDPQFVTGPAVAVHPGGPLGYFIANMRADTVVPVGASSPWAGTLATTVRSALIEYARQIASERRLRSPRAQTRWNDSAESSWKDEMRAATVSALPSISVVMPVLDRINQVGDAIASVQAQTFPHWQLVIVDDGSTDGTWEFLQTLAAKDARIILLRNPKKGVSAARNAGLAAASGKYVAFLDSDNVWRTDYLELTAIAVTREGYRATYASSVIRSGDGKPDSYMSFRGGREHLKVLNHIDMNVLTVERELALQIGGFDEALRRWVDHDFAIRLSAVFEPVLLPFIGCEYEHSMARPDRITVRESSHWQWVVFGKALVDWSAAAKTPRRRGRLSVVIPTYNDATLTLAAMESVLADESIDDVEVIIVDNGSQRRIAERLYRASLGNASLVYKRLPKNYNFAIGCNVGAALATGEYVLFLNNDTIVRPGALGALVDRMQIGDVVGVQPVLLYGDDTVQTAGTVWVAERSLPIHLLSGHPVEDVLPVQHLRFDAVTGAAMMLRAADVVALGGFDPFYVNGMEDVDLCLRARVLGSGGFAVETTALITHLEGKTPGRGKELSENRSIFMRRWRDDMPGRQDSIFRACGFEVVHVGTDGASARVPMPSVTLVRRPGGPRRWALKIASNGGQRGDTWGDTHFASALAAALREAGQDVVTYRHGAHDVKAVAFDDVSLAIRGLDRVRPVPGKLNILWIISHPERVTEDELRDFDLVYAASGLWASKTSETTGVAIRTLLQATDVNRFNTEKVAGAPIVDVVFVGGNHVGRDRLAVTRALDSGVSLAVYGPGWEGKIPEESYAGRYVDNRQLADVYRSGQYVLADHWSDMAADGFIQNRLFDAVAAGCQVISDEVDGIAEIFGKAVRTFRTAEDIRRIVKFETPLSRGEMAVVASMIRRDHSFAARAAQLVHDVEEHLAI
ncbi:glycosyltransferase [Cellulomonas hominis]